MTSCLVVVVPVVVVVVVELVVVEELVVVIWVIVVAVVLVVVSVAVAVAIPVAVVVAVSDVACCRLQVCHGCFTCVLRLFCPGALWWVAGYAWVWARYGPHRQSRCGRCLGLASSPVAMLLLLPLHVVVVMARVLLLCVSFVASCLFACPTPSVGAPGASHPGEAATALGDGECELPAPRRSRRPLRCLQRRRLRAPVHALPSLMDGTAILLGWDSQRLAEAACGWLTLTKMTHPRRRRPLTGGTFRQNPPAHDLGPRR